MDRWQPSGQRGLRPSPRRHALGWEGWLDCFLDGLASISSETITAAREWLAVIAEDRARVLATQNLSLVALRLFELMPQHPIETVNAIGKLLSTTQPTASRAVEQLVATGVLVETTGRQRNRSFVYDAYLEELRVGTELDGYHAP